MLGIGSRHDPRGPQAAGAVKKFIQPIGECEVAFTNILDDLQADSWPVPADERALRATGTAFSVAITVLEALQPQQVNFTSKF
jgi:protein transport protein SEC23